MSRDEHFNREKTRVESAEEIRNEYLVCIFLYEGVVHRIETEYDFSFHFEVNSLPSWDFLESAP
jgi:hypothetical protein